MKNLLALLFFVTLTSLTAGAQGLSTNSTPSEVIIDVRTPEEFNAGHIANAVNIPLDRLETGIHSVKNLSKESPIFIYCRSGRRSAEALALLKKLGFVHAQDIGGMTTVEKSLNTCKKYYC